MTIWNTGFKVLFWTVGGNLKLFEDHGFGQQQRSELREIKYTYKCILGTYTIYYI